MYWHFRMKASRSSLVLPWVWKTLRFRLPFNEAIAELTEEGFFEENVEFWFGAE